MPCALTMLLFPGWIPLIPRYLCTECQIVCCLLSGCFHYHWDPRYPFHQDRDMVDRTEYIQHRKE